MEGVPGQALELRQPNLGESPEAPVYVDGCVGELVPGMADASVPRSTGPPRQLSGPGPARPRLCGVGQSGLGVDLAPAFEDAENDRLAPRPRRPLTRRAEAFLHNVERRMPDLAGLCAPSRRGGSRCCGSARSAAWRAGGGEAANDLADSGLGNSRTLGVPVFHCHAEVTGRSARHEPLALFVTF